MRVLLLLVLSVGACWAGEAPDAQRAEALYNQALGMPTAERIAALAEAARLCPDEARYWVALGDAYWAPAISRPLEPGKEPVESKSLSVDSARRIYLRAALLAPRSPLPHLRLADLCWQTDRQLAAEHLDQAIPLDPGNALPLYERALQHFLAGEDDLGRRLLAKAGACKEMRYPVLSPGTPFGAAQMSVWFAQVQLPFLGQLRELTRQIVRVAAALKEREPGEARALLMEGQRLGHRAMTGEPRFLISLLVGVAIDRIIAEPLAPLLEAQGDTAALAALAARAKALDAMRLGVKRSADEAQARMLESMKPTRVLEIEAALARRLLDESQIKPTIAD